MSKVKTLTAIIKEPGKPPQVACVTDTLEGYQTLVGGYIETVTLLSDFVIICNEEGRINGMPYNVNVCGADFYGTIVAVGRRGDSFASLSANGVRTALNIMEEKK